MTEACEMCRGLSSVMDGDGNDSVVSRSGYWFEVADSGSVDSECAVIAVEVTVYA